MQTTLPMLLAADLSNPILLGGAAVVVVICLFVAFLVFRFGAIWFQAFMSSADVSLFSLIGMSFRQVDPALIVKAKIMGRQAGLNISRVDGMSTPALEAHYLAGGDVMNVIRAIIAAQRAGIDLDFDRAAAIDLAGRDVFEAVRTSVSPVVIDCPKQLSARSSTLSAVAKNGVELRVRARVTVRTNLDQLIGGATEDTIIARVGQGIVSVIGSSDSHMDVLEQPHLISKGVLSYGLDANTAFEIVSIDISDIDVGQNIGARLQSDQAEADMRVAQASAEARRAEAVALKHENIARVVESRAKFVLAESEVPAAMAEAFVAGFMQTKSRAKPTKRRKR